jgi:hypothetical protein
MRIRHSVIVASAVVLALSGTGCSGGGSSGAKSTLSSSAGSLTSAATSAKPAVTVTSAAASSPVKAAGGSFCKRLSDAVNNPDVAKAASGAVADPAKIKALMAGAVAQGEAAVAIAPAAIKSDVVVLIGASAAFFKALQAANFDYKKLDPKALTAFNTPAVAAAAAHVADYLKSTCGIDFGSSPSSK